MTSTSAQCCREPPGSRPYCWQALRYESAEDVGGLGDFILSEGVRYRDLDLASDDLRPREAVGSRGCGLDGWSFLMRTPEKDLGLLYFECRAPRATSAGWQPNGSYRFTWYDSRVGEWAESLDLTADAQGVLQLPAFPASGEVASTDWAAKIVAR